MTKQTCSACLFHDATLVANYADHTIFVARQNATSRPKVRHSTGLMDRSEAPVLGVVFNGVKNIAVDLAAGPMGVIAAINRLQQRRG